MVRGRGMVRLGLATAWVRVGLGSATVRVGVGLG